MKLLRFAALFALVTVPLLLTRKEDPQPAQDVDSEHIFDYDLTAE
jgi:hypothetical protein